MSLITRHMPLINPITLCLLMVISVNLYAKKPRDLDIAFKKSIVPIVDTSKETVYNCRIHEYHGLYGYIGNRYLKVVWPDKNRNIKLRSEPQEVTWEDYKRFLYQNNMHDSRLNKNGCFHNSILRLGFIDEHVNRYRFLDKATNLMWLIPDDSRTNYTYEKAKNQVKISNNTSIDGYSDWRLPTIEEATSLYRRTYTTNTSSETRKRYPFWTSDRLGNKVWISQKSWSSASALIPTNPKHYGYGKPIEEGLILVRSQHKPYPEAYLATMAKYENKPYQEKECRHWERYRGNSDVVRKPESPEWPTVINARKLRTKPIHFVGVDRIDNDKNQILNRNAEGYRSCFRNYYIDTKKDVVIDLATNLMWQKSSNVVLTQYKKLRDKQVYVKQLNDDKFAGEIHWRVPTLQEMLSIMETTAFRNKPNRIRRVHIDRLFDEQIQRYNIADSFQHSDSLFHRHVTLDFDGMGVDRSLYVKPDEPAYDTVKAVRSLTKKEVQHYCQQIEGLTCQ